MYVQHLIAFHRYLQYDSNTVYWNEFESDY